MGYDRGDSFPFDLEPNGIPFGLKSNGKPSSRSYPKTARQKISAVKCRIMSCKLTANERKKSFVFAGYIKVYDELPDEVIPSSSINIFYGPFPIKNTQTPPPLRNSPISMKGAQCDETNEK